MESIEIKITAKSSIRHRLVFFIPPRQIDRPLSPACAGGTSVARQPTAAALQRCTRAEEQVLDGQWPRLSRSLPPHPADSESGASEDGPQHHRPRRASHVEQWSCAQLFASPGDSESSSSVSFSWNKERRGSCPHLCPSRPSRNCCRRRAAPAFEERAGGERRLQPWIPNNPTA